MLRIRQKIKNQLNRKFGDEFRFLKNWVGSPKSVGAIWPSSDLMARKMAQVSDPMSGLPVLELGPGTGVITRAILQHGIKPENLYSVEYSRQFFTMLNQSYPGVNFINGDAFDVKSICESAGVDQFDCVISGLPLLNFHSKKRVQLIEDLLDHLPAGRPIVQFSYGPLSPVVAGRGNYSVRHYDWIARNVPPARLWMYVRD